MQSAAIRRASVASSGPLKLVSLPTQVAYNLAITLTLLVQLLQAPPYHVRQYLEAYLCSDQRGLLASPIIRRRHLHDICADDVQALQAP